MNLENREDNQTTTTQQPEMTKTFTIIKYHQGGKEKLEDQVIVEYPFTIFVNDMEIITLLCTPKSLEALAVGFLISDAFIDSVDEINHMRLHQEQGRIEIYVEKDYHLRKKLRGKRTITSGCGKGSVFYNVLDSFQSRKIQMPLPIKEEMIFQLMQEFNKKSELFQNTGGVHSCALCDYAKFYYHEDDIGRHNALDKIFGLAAMEDVFLEDKIILTTGRISSEMLIKSASRKIPMVISRSAPTSLAINLATELGVTLIGFARSNRMNQYTNF